MSDTNSEKQSLWAKFTGSIRKVDEALHEKPISRIEDVFALIGLGSVVNRNQTFYGAFLLILSYILKGGMFAWGWGETKASEIRTMLNTWTPCSARGQNDSLIVTAARRLFDLQHLYRWLIILGGIGICMSLVLWLIVVAGWIGYLMFVVILLGLFIWSIMSRLAHILVAPLLALMVVGGVILGISYLPNAQPWMMYFAILAVITSMALLAIVFWPISVVARFFSKQTEAQKTFGKFIADYIVVLCWPVSLMVSALMFRVWADTQSQLAYMSIMVIVLSLGLFGIRKEGIRKVLNTAAVSNLFVYLAMVGFQWMVPADMQASVMEQTHEYGNTIVGVYRLSTDDTYFWDVNGNKRGDSVDMKYLKDALADSTLFPQADRRYADVNGDGLSNGSDTVYFSRFMGKTGPKPVKARWLGTPKPRGQAATLAAMPTQQSVPDSVNTGQVSGPAVPKQTAISATSPDAMSFFSFSVKEIEVTDKDIRVRVEWLRSHPTPEAASVSSSTYLVDDRNNKLPIASVDGGLALDGKYELPLNSPFSATLIFPLPADGQMVKTLSLYHYDLPQWGHVFRVMDMTV